LIDLTFLCAEDDKMARASKMGADAATREANRAQSSGHVCATCGKIIPKGELLMVRMVEFEGSRVNKRKSIPYHRNGVCYKT
jgi:hypothetical protein